MLIQRFFKFFPPPKFLVMPAVGIDISDDAVRFIEFGEKKDSLFLKSYGERKLPKGAVESGYVNNGEQVTTVLREMKSKYDLDFIYSTLPEEKAYLYQTEVPSIEPKEMRENIELRLEENVPVAPHEALFDFDVIKQNENTGSSLVSVSVVPLKVVETYLKVFKDAGLTPVGFEVEGKALARSVVPADDKRTFLVINFTEQRTGLFIVSNGMLQFTSTVTIGGDAVTQSIQKALNVSNEEALKIKNEKAFTRGKGSDEVFEYAISSFSALKDEISKVITYWHTRSEGSKKVDKIIFCGRHSLIVGFDKYIAMNVKVPTELANVWSNAFTFDNRIPEIDFVDSLDYAVSAGVALLSHSKKHV